MPTAAVGAWGARGRPGTPEAQLHIRGPRLWELAGGAVSNRPLAQIGPTE